MRRTLFVAVIVAIGLMFPNAAWAMPAGLEEVGITTASSSLSKVVNQFCPAGKVSTGSGIGLTANPAALGWVGVDQIEPYSDGTGHVAAVREAGPYAGSWQANVSLMCADPIPGRIRHSAFANPTSGGFTATATTSSCATGKSVIGVGARIVNGQGLVFLDDVIPSANLKTVTAKAYRSPGSAHDAWSLYAFAICANTPTGLQRIDWPFGAFDSNDQKSTNLGCPGTQGLFSVGFEIFGASGHALMKGVGLEVDSGSISAHEYHSNWVGNWTTTLFLICAD